MHIESRTHAPREKEGTSRSSDVRLGFFQHRRHKQGGVGTADVGSTSSFVLCFTSGLLPRAPSYLGENGLACYLMHGGGFAIRSFVYTLVYFLPSRGSQSSAAAGSTAVAEGDAQQRDAASGKEKDEEEEEFQDVSD